MLAICFIGGLEDTPLNKFRQEDTYWPGHLQQLQLVVDCQVSANFMNGVSLLTNPDLRPVFIRMTRMLAALLDYGWAPKSAADAAQWRPREWNSCADHLCNASMDYRCAVFDGDVSLLAARMRCGCGLQIHSDGGECCSHGTGMGCLIAAWSREGRASWRWDVVAKCCVFLEHRTRSFIAETLAFETAIDMFSLFVFKSCGLYGFITVFV